MRLATSQELKKKDFLYEDVIEAIKKMPFEMKIKVELILIKELEKKEKNSTKVSGLPKEKVVTHPCLGYGQI